MLPGTGRRKGGRAADAKRGGPRPAPRIFDHGSAVSRCLYPIAGGMSNDAGRDAGKTRSLAPRVPPAPTKTGQDRATRKAEQGLRRSIPQAPKSTDQASISKKDADAWGDPARQCPIKKMTREKRPSDCVPQGQARVQALRGSHICSGKRTRGSRSGGRGGSETVFSDAPPSAALRVDYPAARHFIFRGLLALLSDPFAERVPRILSERRHNG